MKRAASMLLAGLLLCLFAGCGLITEILSLSPFPGYLAQAEASVGVDAEISAFLDLENDQWWSDVYVLRRSSDGKDFVFLVVRKDYGGQRVYAFDDSLELLNQAEVSYHSEIHLEEADGRFFVGNVHFDASTFSATEESLDLWGFAFSDGGSNYLVSGGGQQCSIESRSGADWSSESSTTVYVEDTGSGYVDYELRALGYEPEVLDSEIADYPVYLFFHNWEEGYARIVKTPLTPYADTPMTFSDPLVPSYPYSPRIYDVRGEFFRYTRKGFVAEADNRGLFHLLNFNGVRIDRLWVSKEDEPTVDFDLDGEYFYFFDEINLRLYKAVTGW